MMSRLFALGVAYIFLVSAISWLRAGSNVFSLALMFLAAIMWVSISYNSK